MTRLILTAHAFVTLGVLGECLHEFYIALNSYGDEHLAFTYSRIGVAVLCGSYAVAQLVLSLARRISTQALLWFYPLCTLLALSTVIVFHNFGKGWAPADALYASRANAVGFGTIAVIGLAAAYSCYRAWSPHAGMLPNTSLERTREG
jgi:hypothetical protein